MAHFRPQPQGKQTSKWKLFKCPDPWLGDFSFHHCCSIFRYIRQAAFLDYKTIKARNKYDGPCRNLNKSKHIYEFQQMINDGKRVSIDFDEWTGNQKKK